MRSPIPGRSGGVAQGEYDYTPEQKLVLALLCRAVLDARGQVFPLPEGGKVGRELRAKQVRAEARAWLEGQGGMWAAGGVGLEWPPRKELW